jgi:hypothetical protein
MADCKSETLVFSSTLTQLIAWENFSTNKCILSQTQYHCKTE